MDLNKLLFDIHQLKENNVRLKKQNEQLQANLAELTLVALRIKRQLMDERKLIKRR